MDPLIAIGGPALGSLLVLGVRWAVRTGIEKAVNGQLDGIRREISKVGRKVDGFDTWQDSHKVHHSALIAALRRQDIEPPDGWPSDG